MNDFTEIAPSQWRDENGNLYIGRDGQSLDSFLQEFSASQSPPLVPASHKLYKSTLIRRLTEQEAVTLTALLDASPVKSKMLWQASDFLMSGDPLFSTLQAAITGALGAKRAGEILEAE